MINYELRIHLRMTALIHCHTGFLATGTCNCETGRNVNIHCHLSRPSEESRDVLVFAKVCVCVCACARAVKLKKGMAGSGFGIWVLGAQHGGGSPPDKRGPLVPSAPLKAEAPAPQLSSFSIPAPGEQVLHKDNTAREKRGKFPQKVQYRAQN